MPQPTSSHQRLHDLDALRAAAMLIGIAYHAALSFASDFPWLIQDVAQAKWAFVFQAWVHGFRMQLFMLLSGFFTAMLWRRKGLKALLWHRCRRVLFPCLLGLITVVPAMILAGNFASQRNAENKQKTVRVETATASLWAAVKLDDVRAVKGHLAAGISPVNLHPVFAVTPLQWAGLNGARNVTALLLDRNVPVDIRGRDGHTALHGAAFMGHAEVVSLLLQRGADVNARSNDGETPLKSASQPVTSVNFIAGLLSIPLEQQTWEAGREKIVGQLRAAGAKETASAADQPTSGPGALASAYRWLTETPVFILVWFLWFLVWLVALFSVYALLAERFGWRIRGHWLVLSPVNLLWLVPLTLAPTAMMGYYPGIGPDTAMGIIPVPHVLVYYALFFFFGVIYYDCDDREGRLGGSWRWLLPVTLLLIFPLALEFATGTFGFRDSLLPTKFHRPASVVFQSLFAWAMSFASIGLFRALLTRENRTIRYLSDSAYWLYLAHLPLCLVGQAVISQWAGPTWIKLPLFSLGLIAVLLLSYQFLVRYTWIGRFLNGPRSRPGQASQQIPVPGVGS
jgi:hypothetical protein